MAGRYELSEAQWERGSFKKYGLHPQETALVGGAKVPRLGSGDSWLEEGSNGRGGR